MANNRNISMSDNTAYLAVEEEHTLSNSGVITDVKDRPSPIVERTSVIHEKESSVITSTEEGHDNFSKRRTPNKSHATETKCLSSEAEYENTAPALHKNQFENSIKNFTLSALLDEVDDTEEFQGTKSAVNAARTSKKLASSIKAREAAKKGFFFGKKASAIGSKKSFLTGTTQQASKAVSAKASQTISAQAGASIAKSTGVKTLGVAVASALAPVAAVLTGILLFVFSALAVAQVISALFGFWINEANKQLIDGLPPYITYEMVEAALIAQEDYGHPAGCTIAQIIAESGQGDHMSELATRDHNLFGMKWASTYAAAPEVAGKANWQTGEEYNGEHVTITDTFIVFVGDAECIKFRSRVFLQASRYSDNALIQEAIANHNSDKMAEGLKDAGWATDSDYVEKLISIMDTYNLRRFDSMTPDDLKNPSITGNIIVQAAYSQLGVPYVWGGESPGVGLDCSGLTQYCYRQAGISIPHYTGDQYNTLNVIPLSQAQPGDILYRTGHVAIYIGGDEYIHEPHRGAVCTKATGIHYFDCALTYREF